MYDKSTLIHFEYTTTRSFEEVVLAFEEATGSIDKAQFADAVRTSHGDAVQFERHIENFEGSSAFMRFLDIDHSGWMRIMEIPGRAKLYILGNPIIAATIMRYDIGAGLNVPVRVLIYEDAKIGGVKLAYDLPSSLMTRLGNSDVDRQALDLDAKLAALAELATGS